MLTVDFIGAKSAVAALYVRFRCGCAAYEELYLTTPGQSEVCNIRNKKRLLL